MKDGMREGSAEVRRVHIEAQSTVRHREALEEIGEHAVALDRAEDGEDAW